MSEPLYCVVTTGQLVTGFDRSLVESNLVQLCKYTPEQVVRVLSGERIVFKSALNQATADRYLNALTAAGLVCSRELVPVSAKPPVGAVSTPPKPAAIRTARPQSFTAVAARKNRFAWGMFALVLLVVAMVSAVGVFAVPRLWSYAEGKFRQVRMQGRSTQSADFAYVTPPAQPPVQSRKKYLDGAEMQQLRDLLVTQQYAALNAKLEAIQTGFEHDPTQEFVTVQASALFSESYLPHRHLYDDWVTQFPDHYAAYLARAEYFEALGWKSRGGGWANETSDEQFAGMRNYFSLAKADYKQALKLNPRLLVPHINLIYILMAQGPKNEMNEQINTALQRFPASYQLYKKILETSQPRWGGSYALMTEYAHRANQHVAEDPDMSFLYGKPYMEMAWYAKRDKQYQKAIDLYTQALSYGQYADLLEKRGQAYERINDLDSALSDYRRAMEINPASFTVYELIANIVGNRGDSDAALALIEQSQNLSTKRDSYILSWYGWAIQYLLTSNNPALNKFIDAANRYEAANKAKPYPPGAALKYLPIQHRFRSPPGTKPYGLAWLQGSLYLSSFRDAPGIYQLDPVDGRIIKAGVPDIVFDRQFGGLAADNQHLYHLQAYYDRNLHKIDPQTLGSTGKTYLYTSHFQLSDMAVHDQHVYAIGYHLTSNLHDYRLLKFSLDGILRESFEITPVRDKTMSAGMASDGTWLWVSMGNVLYQIDPATGDVIDGFSLPGDVHCLAFDGEQLWGATLDGKVFTMAVQP